MPTAKTRLLLAEDDPAMVELLRFTFEKQGFDVVSTPSGEEALLLASESPPDIVILDWMLEELSGLEVCRRMRRTPESSNLPIIMLSARGEEADRVRGLETGADDYVTKPFSPPELIARVRAVLRRVRPALAGMVLSVGDLELDMASYKVRRGSTAVSVGPTEFKLLRHFLEHPGHVFSREQLLDAVWGRDTEVESRTVDVYVRRLRRAINVPGHDDLIRTVRSAGYALDAGA
jgi:two-component system phosphate regulon response regulator PhoB